MNSRFALSTTLALGALFAATTLEAQDAPGIGLGAPEEAPQAEPAPEPAPAPAPEAQAPVAEAPLPPNLDVRTFGDWELRCEEGSNNCFMYQLAVDAAQNPVSEITLIALPEDNEAAAGVTVITPLGTALTEGVVMQIDSSPARQYPFGWCTRSGCYSRFGLTDEEVAAMRRGAEARIRIVSVSAPEEPVVLSYSLSGFTAAYNAMTSAVN